MVEFSWKLKDREGRLYTRKHLPALMRAYQNGEIADGDLLFQSDETKPWIEIRNLKSLFQSFQKEDILRREKVVDKKIISTRILHIELLLFIFIILTFAVIRLVFTGQLLPLSLDKAFNISSKIIFTSGSLLVLAILLFLPLTRFYSIIFNWKDKMKQYFLQQDQNWKDENLSLQAVENLAQGLSSSLDKNSLLRSILDSVLKISKFSAGFLLLRNFQLHKIFYETGSQIDRTMFKKTEYSFDEPIIKELLRDREIIWTLDIDKKEFNYFFRPEKIQLLGEADSMILLPLAIEEEVLGILGLYGTRQNFINLKQQPFLASIIKSQASLALGSAIQSELAILDRLTGLLNHEYFLMRLREEIERSRRFRLSASFLMIDLDYFKNINDTYGHQIGDQVLKSIATILKENTRVVDLSGRYGGEEFAILLIDTNIEGAKIKAEQLRKTIEEKSFIFNGRNIKLTISIGLGIWDWSKDQELSYKALVEMADKELYRAKNEGRNRICFTPTPL